MSADVRTTLIGPSGPTHAGEGDQYNFFGVVRRRRTAPGAWSEEHFQWLGRLFVWPGGFERAREILAEQRTVILLAASGSGRRTAAMMLLADQHAGQGRFRELTTTTDIPEEPPLDSGLVEAGDRLLLDLSAAEEGYSLITRDLMPYHSAVKERGARLVVILPESTDLDPDFRRFVARIERPDTSAVLIEHLRAEGLDPDAEARTSPDVVRHLDHGPLRRIAGFAGLVREARDADPGGVLAGWLKAALDIVAGGDRSVATDIKNLQTAQQRALLFSAAMFAGCRADSVFYGTMELLRSLPVESDGQHPLEGDGLDERLADVNAALGPRRQVRFTKLAYDSRVRAYFWDNFPALRSHYRRWVDSVVMHRALSPEEREIVVRRFADEALRVDRPKDLLALIKAWTAASQTVERLALPALAVALLEAGLADERYGGRFRYQIYQWAVSPGTSDGLAVALIAVCADVLVETYPDQALVRLRRLAQRPGDTGIAASNAINSLVVRDRRLLRLVVDRIVQLARPQPSDLALFVRVIEPYRLLDAATRTRPLAAEARLRGQLITGWRTVMKQVTQVPAPWAGRVRTWLQASAKTPGADMLLDILVQAAIGNPRALGTLHVIARDWSHQDSRDQDRATTARVLDSKIDAAQGIKTDLRRSSVQSFADRGETDEY